MTRRTSRARASAAVSATAVLAVALLTGCAAPSPTAARFEMLGFQEESSPAARIDASARAMSYVGIDGVTLAHGGGSVHPVSDAALAQLRRAHHDGLPAELLVSNFDDGIGDFSPELGTALLSSPTHRAAVVTRLAAEVRRHGWDGVMVDLESLRARDRQGSPPSWASCTRRSATTSGSTSRSWPRPARPSTARLATTFPPSPSRPSA